VARPPSRVSLALFGITIFLGAFLLFQVQLVIAKYILPWYGGVPTVWTTCMLFFQVLLLGGYAYAHMLARRLRPFGQRLLHLSLLVAALALLGAVVAQWGVPLLPGADWRPRPQSAPIGHIVLLLTVAVGLPYFVVATTSPLLQSWFAGRYPTTSPYRLYALSNAGSLLALLTYPAFFEVWLPVRTQAWIWAALFALFACGVAASALASRTHALPAEASLPAERAPSSSVRASAGDIDDVARLLASDRPPARSRQWLMWTALAAVPSALLLATTNYMSQEIAVIPLLWIAPLGAYLLSFVLTFDSDRWYARGVWMALLVLGITLATFVIERSVYTPLLLQIGVAELMLFAACMVCHGEVARLKPAAKDLTAFYLAVTVGGAVGGAFVSLVAPSVFPSTWEYPIGIWLAGVLALVCLLRDHRSPVHTAPGTVALVAGLSAIAVGGYVFRAGLPWKYQISDSWLFGTPSGLMLAGLVLYALGRRWRVPALPSASRRPAARATAVATMALMVFGSALASLAWLPVASAVHSSRSFYGTVQVEAIDRGGDGEQLRLRHGRIVHGKQYRAPDAVDEPTAYYGRDSGAGLAIEHHPHRASGLRIGVVGLGVGTMAALGEREDTVRFYELNPDVIQLSGPMARTFTFVRDTPARVEIVTGDARLAMEAELARGERQRFDVLAIDAFSSDAIPAHLLTREAVAVYLAHLHHDGVLAVHITNRYVDLRPVIRGLASHFGLAYAFIEAIEGAFTWSNDWALLTRDPARLRVREIADATASEASAPRRVLWTDDYSNLVALLKR
jgi:spermidine synthase